MQMNYCTSRAAYGGGLINKSTASVSSTLKNSLISRPYEISKLLAQVDSELSFNIPFFSQSHRYSRYIHLVTPAGFTFQGVEFNVPRHSPPLHTPLLYVREAVVGWIATFYKQGRETL